MTKVIVKRKSFFDTEDKPLTLPCPSLTHFPTGGGGRSSIYVMDSFLNTYFNVYPSLRFKQSFIALKVFFFFKCGSYRVFIKYCVFSKI